MHLLLMLTQKTAFHGQCILNADAMDKCIYLNQAFLDGSICIVIFSNFAKTAFFPFELFSGGLSFSMHKFFQTVQ